MGQGARALSMLVIAAVTVALLPTLSTPAATADSVEPSVHTPAPRPGALVDAGDAELRAHVVADTPVEHVEMTLDDAPLPVTIDDGEAGNSVVRAPATLEAGQREARVRVIDADGRQIERTWSFTATDRTVERLAGPTRIDTAVAVSQATYPEEHTAGAVVLARGDDFADALTGVPLAAAVDGPLLLTGRGALSEPTAEELLRVLEPGATVHLLGGSAALGPEVQDAVEALGVPTTRHSGSDRYATAAAVAAALPASDSAVLASGVDFPDALAASAPAARDGAPVLLTTPEGLPAPTAGALSDLAPREVTVVGGPAAVSTAVEHAAADLVESVHRIAGSNRYATAAAVLDAFYDDVPGIALASGIDFPDALAGARHAAATGQPLLLTDPGRLSGATDIAVRALQPGGLVVYGGEAAVSADVGRAAVMAAENGAGGPRVTATRPAAGDTVAELSEVVVEFDRPVNGQDSTVYVEVGGVELSGATSQSAAGALVYRASGANAFDIDVAHPVHVAVAARGTDGRAVHHEAGFTYLQPDPVFATAGPVELHLPSRNVELVAYHQANHPGAQQQQPRDTATRQLTLPSRNRGTGSRTAADVVADPDSEVLAPVSGRVVRGGSYVLYCDYRDEFVVIDPDDRPGWEVKILHFHGLQVAVGDRVEADRTVIGSGPRPLPFRSQVDAYTHARNWPHLHIEVVDPTVPTRPGRGC